jgi:hypothetical protein
MRRIALPTVLLLSIVSIPPEASATGLAPAADGRGGLSVAMLLAGGTIGARGATAQVVVPVAAPLAIGLAAGLANEVSSDELLVGGGGAHRVGLAFALGAPWTTDLLGIRGELGVARGRRTIAYWSEYGLGGDGKIFPEHEESYASAYGALAGVIQWFPKWRRNPLRPYNAIGVSFVPIHYDRRLLTITFELGVAFHAW